MNSKNTFSCFLGLAVALILSFENSIAQIIDFKMGDSLDYTSYNTLDFFAIEGPFVCAARASIKKGDVIHHIDIYDKNSLKLASKIKVPLPVDTSIHYSVRKIIKADQKYLLFYSYFDNLSKQLKLEEADFDFDGNISGNPHLLDSSQGLSPEKSGVFYVSVRKGAQEFSTWGEKPVFNQKQKADSLTYAVKFFDYDCHLKKSIDYPVPQRSREAEYILETAFDSENNFYFFSVLYEKRKDYVWKIKIYTSDSLQPFTYELSSALRKRISLSSHVYSYEDSSGHVNFFSLYGDGVPGKLVPMGFYCLQINKTTHRIEKEKLIKFSDYSILDMESYFIMGFVNFPDGSLKIICEKRVALISTMYGMEVSRQFNIGSIFTARITPDFKLDGICYIDKNQKVMDGNSEYTGFNYLSSGDTCFFVYNDLPENISMDPRQPVKTYTNSRINKGVLVSTTANSYKVLGERALFEKKDKKDIAVIKIIDSIHLNNSEEFLLIQLDDAYRILKLFVNYDKE